MTTAEILLRLLLVLVLFSILRFTKTATEVFDQVGGADALAAATEAVLDMAAPYYNATIDYIGSAEGAVGTASGNSPNFNTQLAPIPLDVLVQSASAANTSCPPGSSPILDNPISSLANTDVFDGGRRKIPRILHITSKSRCATPQVHHIVDRWRQWGNDKYAVYFHDDEAVARLNNHPLTQTIFPLLNETLKCVTNGATKSDLWRYLVLYTYGGVYTDIDNLAVALTEDSIQPDHDSFFVIELLGIISQYFIATSPQHPLMKLTLEQGMHKLRGIVNVMRNNPALNTGPGALKNGFIVFMNHTSDGYVTNGTYIGVGERYSGRSVTAIGEQSQSQHYIDRSGLNRLDKLEYYKAVGIEHFHDNKNFPRGGRISCMEHLVRTNGTNRVARYRAEGGQYVDDNG